MTFLPNEQVGHEESLKVYRDLKNVVDTAFDDGKAEGLHEKALEAARNLKKMGVPLETIAQCVGLPLEVVMDQATANNFLLCS